MSELTKRSFLNLVTSVFKSFGLMLLTFIMTPILLKLIGSTYFGTFKVLMETYATFSLLEMGLFASIVACMIPTIKEGKKEVLDDLLSESKRRFMIVMLLNVLTGIALFPFLKKITSWPFPDATELYVTWGLIISTAVFIPSLNFKAYLEAGNEGHKLNLIFMFQNMCYLVFGILFAWFGWNLKAQAIAGLVSGLIGVILLKKISGLDIKLRRKKSERFHATISKNQKPQILNEIAVKFGMNCDQIIIAFFIGPLMVTKVFLGQRVIVIVQNQLQSIGQAFWASLGSLYYERDKNPGLFEKRMMEMNKFLATLSIAILVPTCILNRAFIELWVGEAFLMDTDALVYLASSDAFFHALFSFWGLLFAVLGKPQEITKMFWTQALINITGSIVFTQIIGGVGPIAGTFVSNILIPLWYYPVLLKENFSLPFKSTFNAMVWPGLVGVFVVSSYHFSPWKLENLSWGEFLLSGMLIFSVFSLCLYLVFFSKEEKVIIQKRFQVLWQNLRKRT